MKKTERRGRKVCKTKRMGFGVKNIETNISLLYNTSCETLKPTKRRKLVIYEF